ncbi:PREDICTED: ATP-binding cassette sub-family G member 2-like [Gekko japonicus]|uniref:ATP-binding cassette sub-family G member 2-like n=1 Tax=Gekko japonicus TaxID=146911 RepID=A0ABM1KE45_GEKJA|nr:PREDICTED: ATP-binding cassette sub-family G member 2-like [Gekko japonicus]
MGTVDVKDFVSVGPVEFSTWGKNAAAPGLSYQTMGDEGGQAGTFVRSVPTRESLRSPRGSVVSFHNIQYSIKRSHGLPCKRRVVEKKILQNVYGIMKPGMNAILGPTGSGKSSLLDVLAARKDPAGLSGDVLIDGALQPPNFKCISGYVVQVGTELIRGVSGGERKRTNIGMELITEPPVLFLDEPTTGLDASTANAVLRLLKRLSRRGRTIIFSIHQPRYSIFKLFDSLTLLALGKVLYHGPAKHALEYFRSVGYECEPFNNPADFFLDVINGDSTAVAAGKGVQKSKGTDVKIHTETNDENAVEEEEEGEEEKGVVKTVVDSLHEKYIASSQYQDLMKELLIWENAQGVTRKKPRLRTQVTYANSFFTQLYWVSQRSLKNLVRNPQASVAQVLVTVILALIVGAIFFGVKLDSSGIQNRVGSLFFVTTNQCFSSVSSIELFIRDKKLFIHQYTSGYYRVSAYFVALMFGDLLPMRTMPAIIFSCISYWMIGYQADAGRFFFFMLTLVLVSYTSTSMALAISAGMDVVAIANLVITICFVFMLIFSGLLVNLPSVMGWLNWLKYFSIPRYGLTALEVNEFRGLYFCGSDRPNGSESLVLSSCSQNTSQLGQNCYGEQYLCSQGVALTNWAMWENIVALVCMTVIFLTIAYAKLRFMKKFT